MKETDTEILQDMRMLITAGLLYLVVRDETKTQSCLLAFAVCGGIAMYLTRVRPQNILSLCKALSKILSRSLSWLLTPNESSSPTAGGGSGGAQKGQTK